MKKSLSILLAVLFTLAMVSGCSGRTGSAASSTADSSPAASTAESGQTAAEPAEIRVLTQSWADEIQDSMKKYFVDDFMAKYPNIKINWEQSADFLRVAKTQVASGNAPDMMSMEASDAVQYNATGKLYDLTAYSAQYGWKERIFPWAYSAGVLQDKLVCLPLCYEALAVWYNNDLLKKYGLPVPADLEGLKKVVKAAGAEGVMPFTFGKSGGKQQEWWISVLLNSYAGGDNVAKALRGEKKWTDPEFEETIRFYCDIWNENWINDKQSLGITINDARALWAQQKGVFKVEGTSASFSRALPA